MARKKTKEMARKKKQRKQKENNNKITNSSLQPNKKIKYLISVSFHYIHKIYMCSIKMLIIFIEKSMYIFDVTIFILI